MKKKISIDMELLFCGFMLFIFAPLEIYFSSINDLWFTVYDFAGYLIIAFIVYVVCVLLLNYLFANRFSKGYNKFVYYMFLLGLAFYVQGNFFLIDYGQLDGSPINWSEYRLEGFVSVGLFIAILVLGTVILIKMRIEKVRKVTKGISLCLILIQFITLTTISLVTDGFTVKEDYVSTSRNEWNYSSNENFNILLLDAFDSRVFDELLNGECKSEIEELFSDFTYYRNTTSVYPYTDYSIPQIITGKNYLNQELYGDYINDSYSSSPLLTELKKKNYRTNIYQFVRIPSGDIVSEIDNWERTRLTVSSHKRLLGYIYKLVGFRYLPQPLKQTCWFYPDDEMDDMKIVNYVDEEGNRSNKETIEVSSWDNKRFYENIDQLRATEEENVFHFYHLKGLHPARNLDKDFNDAKDVSLQETAKGMFNLLDRYLNKLKEEGIYDDSIIIIMADHAEEGYLEPHYKQCPLLLVKGIGENHAFAVTDIPVSYSDLQVGYRNLLNKTNLDNIFEIQDKNRERDFYFTTYKGRAMNFDDCGNDFERYVIKGHAFDSESIIKTGEIYSYASSK